MFRNYLAAALRNLVRNRLYAAINIIGLAIGFVAVIFAGLFLRDELTYDRWLPGYRQVYDVATTLVSFKGTPPAEHTATFPGVANWLKLDYPQIAATARLFQREVRIRRGDRRGVEQGRWADPEIFTVLPVHAVAGDLATALDAPDSVVLTRTQARKYFGRDAPIGETLEINGGQVMRITAVIEDWPSNSNFGDLQIFLSGKAAGSPMIAADAQPYDPNADHFTAVIYAATFVRLKPGVSIDAIRDDLPAFVARHMPVGPQGDIQLRMRPLAALHLDKAGHYIATHPGAVTTLYAVGFIGVLTAAIAVINFVNLMTARGTRRAVEVSVRKVSGAVRRDLIVQFIGESFVYGVIGIGAAVSLTLLLLPGFDVWLDRAIIFNILDDPYLLAGLAALPVIMGLLGGFYPAFVLSSFAPAAVLKSGGIKAGGSSWVRQGLVILQFAILIGLMLATAEVYRQTEFAMNDSLRFDKDQVLVLERGCTAALKAEIQALPGVSGAACSWSSTYGIGASYGSAVSRPGAPDLTVSINPVDFGYFEVLGLKPVAGRFLSPDHSADTVSDAAPEIPAANPGVVINETAMRALGFVSAEEAVGQTLQWRRMLTSRAALGIMPLSPSEIIGVVPDFSVRVQTVIQPTIYYADMAMSAPAATVVGPAGAQTLNIKLRGRNIPETVAAIDRLWAKAGDPDRPVERRFVEEWLQTIYLDITREGELFAAFSAVAMFTACLGLFGLAAFTAERRTKEIGVRKALGASQADVLRLLVWQFAKPVLWANLIAWPVGYYFMRRWLQGFAYHVDLEPWIFVAASTAALAIAVLTVMGHALLIARTQPVAALRYE